MSSHAQTDAPVTCDPETGLCTIAPLPETIVEVEQQEGVEIIYVGDPMCSWCWGISPQLRALEYRAVQEGIPFRIVVGGLRPGGGDAWDDKFKDFLRHHWQEVTDRSGQPFGYDLFERAVFDYDTEPACRAVVAARQVAPEREHDFYEQIQHRFYVKNEDPKEDAFYRPICDQYGIDYEAFLRCFHDEQTKAATQAEFQLNRSWGVRGYPTVLLRKDQELFLLATGYSEYEQMWEGVTQAMK